MSKLRALLTPELPDVIQRENNPILSLMEKCSRGELALNRNEPASNCGEMTTEDRQTTADCEQTSFDAGQTTTARQGATSEGGKGRESLGIVRGRGGCGALHGRE